MEFPTSIKDDRGYNQGFKPSEALEERTKYRASLIIENMSPVSHATVLELGCGTGDLSYFIAKHTGHEVIGTDICRPFIDGAKKEHILPNLKYEVVDFNDPRGLKERKFDYIIGNGILHHLYYNIEGSLKNILSLLKDGGKIMFWEPNILNPYCFLIFNFKLFRKLANLEPGEMAFTKNFIKEKLEKAGFKNIQVEYRDFLVPVTPAPLIKPIQMIGNILERMPLLNKMSQSIFITAVKR